MKIPKNYFLAFGIPVLYAFAMRGIFVNDLLPVFLAVMSVAFIVGLPMGIGALTVVLSPLQISRKILFQIFAPWIPVLIFLSLTLLFAYEGAICILMAAPVFLLFASIGGLLIGLIRRYRTVDRLNISIAVLIPLLISPIERTLDIKPVTYEAITSITINSSGERIWKNVVRVREISESEDNGKLSRFMGFPRPIKAELDTLKIGGRRKAIFDKGLAFDETVYIYEHQKRMSFSIVPLTNELQPGTMDEHVIVGGKYFNVLDGTYELEKIGENKYNLKLYSHFQMSTSLNFYSGLWANLIMKDIQENILRIIKNRSES